MLVYQRVLSFNIPINTRSMIFDDHIIADDPSKMIEMHLDRRGVLADGRYLMFFLMEIQKLIIWGCPRFRELQIHIGTRKANSSFFQVKKKRTWWNWA